MHRDPNVSPSFCTAFVAGTLFLLLALPACERSVGVTGRDGGAGRRDGQVQPDGSGQHDGSFADARQGEFLSNVTGWRSEAFEHSTFVPEAAADPIQLDMCDPYLTAVEGNERWWASGGWEDALALHPYVDGTERMGLMIASGWLSPPGEYGHGGWFQRMFELTEWELLLCPTVERLGHCPLPREADLCVIPVPYTIDSVETYLARVIPGPASNMDHYELRITYNPDVADGTTVFHVTFALPLAYDPMNGWENIDIVNIVGLDLVEERSWAYYLQIPYPLDHDGWVMRNLQTDTLKISLSGRNDPEGPVHIWGDFTVDEVIYMP